MSRRDHQCAKDGCHSEAKWHVSLAFMTEGFGLYRRRICCASSLVVCGEHTNSAMEYVLSPINRGKITRWLIVQNYPPPDFDTAEFEFTRVEHDTVEDKLHELRTA